MPIFTQSVLAWVQFGQKDLMSANQFLKEISTPGTLDELGFGRLRDYYSELFFPATTTVMTHVRYLVFLPALLRESALVPHSEKQLENLQSAVCRALKKKKKKGSPNATGIIGATAGEDLRRFPAEIYWTAMQDLEIVCKGVYLRRFLNLQRKGITGPRDDDGGHDETAPEALLDEHALELGIKALYLGREKRDSLNFQLTLEEREFLSSRFRKCDPQSLFSYLLDNPNLLGDKLWAISPKGNPGLSQALQDARAISMLAMGCYLIYGYLLASKAANGEEVRPKLSELINGWRSAAVVRRNMSDYPIAQALDRVDAAILRQSAFDDIGFIRRMHEQFKKASSAEDLISRTKDDIRKREGDLKSTRARLGPGKIRLDEQETKYYSELTAPDWCWTHYRWRVAYKFLNELIGVTTQVPRPPFDIPW